MDGQDEVSDPVPPFSLLLPTQHGELELVRRDEENREPRSQMKVVHLWILPLKATNKTYSSVTGDEVSMLYDCDPSMDFPITHSPSYAW